MCFDLVLSTKFSFINTLIFSKQLYKLFYILIFKLFLLVILFNCL